MQFELVSNSVDSRIFLVQSQSFRLSPLSTSLLWKGRLFVFLFCLYSPLLSAYISTLSLQTNAKIRHSTAKNCKALHWMQSAQTQWLMHKMTMPCSTPWKVLLVLLLCPRARCKRLSIAHARTANYASSATLAGFLCLRFYVTCCCLCIR